MLAKGRKGIPYLMVFLGLTLICGRAPAQIITGEMSGTVTDASGAVVPGASVTVTNEGTGAARTGESGSNGEFVFTALRPGEYTVKVEKAGFQASERKSINLTANQRVALGNVQLTVGQVTQTVEVTAQGEVVNTESADSVGLLSNIQVDNLGVKGRDVMQLLRVLPGVATVTMFPWGGSVESDPAGTEANGGQFGSFTPAVGGARLFWNTVTVDGQVGSNPDFPGLFMAATSIDAVAEVKIVSNNYTADYGRNPGSTIAVVTKSGTKDFHGTVYGYKRHEKLNANDFFNNRDGIEKSVYRFGTFGFAVGGPVYIPNKFNTSKEKLFFFYSQENWTVKQPQGITQVTVPTALERTGDFSQSIYQGTIDENTGQPIPVTLVDPDPTNANPIVNNVIPGPRLNSQGQLLMNVMPLPNRFDPTQPFNYEWRDICEIPRLLQALKLDYHPSAKDTFTVSGRRWWVDTRAYGCRVLGFADDLPIFKHHYAETTDTVQVAWTRIVSPTIVNEFNIGFVGEKELSPATNLFGRTGANYFDPIKRSTLGFTLGQLYPGANTNDILPQAYFGGVPNGAYLNTEDRFPDNQGYPRFNMANNLSWIRGPHTFKFGVYLERSWATDGPHAGCFNGCFDFGQDVNNPFDTTFAFANAALGTFTSYSESDSRKFYLMANKVWEWFAQDTWKVNRKLTLTYGARFSWFTPWKVNKGLGAEFVEDRYDRSQVPPLYQPVLVGDQRLAQNPTNGDIQPEVYIGAFTGPMNFPGMVLSSDSSYPAGFRKQHGVQVSPRFGFSYDPFGNGKTAIRGGFAVMKATTPSYGTYAWSMVTNPPVQLHPSIYYGTMDTLLSRSGLLFPGGASTIELDDKITSVYRYSLGIQRDIGFNTIVDVSYVGNVGRHLIQSQDQNAVPYGARFLSANQDPTTGTALPETFYRRIPGYEGIGMTMNAGISNYNSLQMALNRRFTKGLSFGIAYTWAHTLNTGSGEGDGIASFRPWRIWNYGPANFDQTQMFVLNYVWDLPKPSKFVDGSTAKLLLGSVFDNWQVSGVTTLASGLPQAIYMGTISGLDLSGGGDGTRANVIARPQLAHGDRTFDRWFNTEAFAMPALPYETSPGSDQWVVDPGNASVFPVRGPGQNNWDITLMKKFPLKSESRSLQFRFEFYNAFNHTQFSGIDSFALFDDTTAGFPQVNNTFGQVTSTRQPRIIQLSIRFDF